MWDYKLSPDRADRLNSCNSSGELIETVSEDTDQLIFDVEEILIEHFHKDELSYFAVCV